jgi:ubiquinone/menaquinone biosynthesis C-methylase UbiE
MANQKEHSSSNLNKYECTHLFAVNRITNFSNYLQKLIMRVKHSRILDLGCGEGFDIKNIISTNKIDFEFCCGLDLNYESLRFSRDAISGASFHVVNGDVRYLPFKPREFDLILCLEVLEHLDDPDKVLEEISRQSIDFCIFSVPNEPLYRLTRMIVFRQNIRQLGNHPEHIHNWSKRAFVQLLEKHFSVDHVFTPFPWTVVLCHSKKRLVK